MNWKKMTFAGIASVSLAMAGTGCHQAQPPTPPAAAAPAAPSTNAPAEKGTLQTVIEGAAGKTAVDQGRAAQEKIRKISEQRNKDLDEVTQ
jgi:hypothetical protein